MKRTVFAFSFCARWMESQPERPASSNFGFTIVCQVKMRSSEVTGLPSLHLAFLLSVTWTVNGRVFTTFPFAMYGAVVKWGFTMYGLASAIPAVHAVHVLLHPSRKPFRHGGSCSAPKTTVPLDERLDAPPAVPATARPITPTRATAKRHLWCICNSLLVNDVCVPRRPRPLHDNGVPCASSRRTHSVLVRAHAQVASGDAAARFQISRSTNRIESQPNFVRRRRPT